MEKTEWAVVADAGPLIHLDELGCLNLLACFHQVLVSSTVQAEFDRYRISRLDTILANVTICADPAPDASLMAIAQVFTLHRGEISALALMREKPDSLFLTDDTAARLAARQLGYQVHGSVGILLRAVRMKQMNPEAAIELLRAIPTRSSLHIRQALLDEMIEEVARYQIR